MMVSATERSLHDAGSPMVFIRAVKLLPGKSFAGRSVLG